MLWPTNNCSLWWCNSTRISFISGHDSNLIWYSYLFKHSRQVFTEDATLEVWSVATVDVVLTDCMQTRKIFGLNGRWWDLQRSEISSEYLCMYISTYRCTDTLLNMANMKLAVDGDCWTHVKKPEPAQHCCTCARTYLMPCSFQEPLSTNLKLIYFTNANYTIVK